MVDYTTIFSDKVNTELLVLHQCFCTKLKLLYFAQGLPKSVSARGKEFRSQIQSSAIWLEDNIKFLFYAQPALFCGRIIILCSVYHTPLNIKIFVLLFQVPDMCRESCWVFVILLLKCTSVLVESGFESVAGQSCISVGGVVTFHHCGFINHTLHLTVPIQGTWSQPSRTITARLSGFFLTFLKHRSRNTYLGKS